MDVLADLSEARAVDANLVDIPSNIIGHGKKQAVRIEVKIHFANKRAIGWTKQGRQLTTGSNR